MKASRAIASPPAAPRTRGFREPKRTGLRLSSFSANVGTYDFGRRLRKSKIWVRPGLVPVAKEDHETGVCAGLVGSRGE